MGGDLLGHGLHPRLEPGRGHDLVDEARGMRLLGRDEPRPHDHLLHARGAEELDAARVVFHREAVAERACDGKAEARLRCSDSDVADRGDREAPTHRVAFDLRDDGLADALQPARSPLAVALVLDAVLRGLEALELADVGAGHEGLAPRAAQHEDTDRVVGVHLFAGLVQPLVHVPRQGVAGFGAIEGQRYHRTFAGDEDLARVLRLVCQGSRLLRFESPHRSTAEGAQLTVPAWLNPVRYTSPMLCSLGLAFVLLFASATAASPMGKSPPTVAAPPVPSAPDAAAAPKTASAPPAAHAEPAA